MPRPTVITIDGPASSGKSTLGERLAQQCGYTYFDTGVMYRALTLVARQQDYDLHDGAALCALAQQITIEVRSPTVQDARQYTVLVDGRDVTWDIRSADVDRHVSLVSSYPGVRAELIRQQRIIGQRGQVVMVGRDIGTVVMPDAPLKLYIDASLDERARRRAAEQRARGHATTIDEVRADLSRRDQQDNHVMHAAPDALHIITDGLSPSDIVAQIMARLEQPCVAETTEEAPYE